MQNDYEANFNPTYVYPVNLCFMSLHIPSILTVHFGTKKTQRSGTT